MKTTLKISLAALLSVAACWSAAQTVSAMRGSEVPAVDNVCLDCHIHKEVRGQKIPQVKESHLVKPVNPDAPVIDKARWQCNSCHVPQIDAKPLVENVFKGNTAAK